MLSLADILPVSPAPSSRPTIRSARSKNRAAAWQHDLAQWRVYQISRMPSEARRAEIEIEYEKLLGAGPDFTAYHTGSSFVDPPVNVISREDRIRALAAFDVLRSALYRHCRSPRGQAISMHYRAVYGVLLTYAQRKGKVFPCLQTIAAAAMCSRTTVLRALDWLRLYGLVDRMRRLTRVRTALGSLQTRQTSNCYRVGTTLRSLSALALNVFRRGPSATGGFHHLTKGLSKEETAPRDQQTRLHGV